MRHVQLRAAAEPSQCPHVDRRSQFALDQIVGELVVAGLDRRVRREDAALADARDRPLMVMPLGNDAIVRAHIPDARLATGDWWDAITLAPGIATTLTPAVHRSEEHTSELQSLMRIS